MTTDLEPFVARIRAAHKRRFKAEPVQVDIWCVRGGFPDPAYFEADSFDQYGVRSRWLAYPKRVVLSHSSPFPTEPEDSIH
jgi:hypothetical protein